MSLIPCTDDCLYQKDGCCNLQHAASSGPAASSAKTGPSAESSLRPGTGRSKCVHYTPRAR